MKGHWWLWMMLTAGLMTGCSADEPIAGGGVPIVHPDVTPTAVTEPEITFQVSDDWQNMADTRATITSAGALTSGSFKVFVYEDGTTNPYINAEGSTVNYVTDAWAFADGKHYWPASGNLDFFAYRPATPPSYVVPTYTVADADGNGVADGPTLTCTNLPVNSAGQAEMQEFVYAYATAQNKTNAASGVALNFLHPFAVINFAIKTTHPAIYSFNSIELTKVRTNGVFTYGKTTQWAHSGDVTTLEMTTNAERRGIAANANFSAEQIADMGLPFIVIPQYLNEASPEIIVNLQWNEGDANATTYTFNNPQLQYEAGKIYTYTLDLNHAQFNVSVDSWTAEDSARTPTFTAVP